MSARFALVRNEARLLARDPVPAVVLIGMPLVLAVVLSPALSLALAADGQPGVSGSAQAVPGMACVFALFGAAVAGFALMREHGWRTWTRLRASGMSRAGMLASKLVMPAALLLAQAVVLFGVGVLTLDLTVTGSWLAVALVAASVSAMVLAGGIAAASALGTVQQLNAAINLTAMGLGGIGGALVPVAQLPDWLEPVAPLSPVFWAMRGYRSAILEGGGIAEVAPSAGVVGLYAAAFALTALVFLRRPAGKRAWG